MCGLAGFILHQQLPEAEHRLKAMGDLIPHRGADGEALLLGFLGVADDQFPTAKVCFSFLRPRADLRSVLQFAASPSSIWQQASSPWSIETRA